MVQLNTTYDSSIHQKVFVLKGDEAYARTTDTIATLITDFGDFDNHISYCHIGLEIQVLRELGNSNLHIYCDDELLYTIPWVHDGMAEIIDSDWNEKGVYWENGKLLIGKYSLNPLVNTGLYLLYDVEHKIEVRYEPNNYCLGSSAKPIVFTVPTPETFASTLTLSSDSQRYASSSDVDDIELLFECENDTQYSKSVLIYDGDSLLDTVTVEQDTPLTLDLSELDDGLHTIKAVFNGDDEAYASETEYQISVGYKITNLEYPSCVIQGDTGTLSCNVLDYFDEPYVGLNITVVECILDWGWETISSQSPTDGNGFVSINPVYYSEKEFAISDGNWYGERHTTDIIAPTSVNVAFDEPITEREQFGDGTLGDAFNNLTAFVLGNNQPIEIAGIPLTIHLQGFNINGTIQGVTNNVGKYLLESSIQVAQEITATVSVDGTDISNSAKWIIPEYWWSLSKNKQVGTPIYNNVSVAKVSNGFKLKSTSTSVGQVTFNFSPLGNGTTQYVTGTYRIEFDAINLTALSSGADIRIHGKSIPVSSIEGKHIKVVNNFGEGRVRVYANSSLITTIAVDNVKKFIMQLYDMSMVIDNLVIVREQ